MQFQGLAEELLRNRTCHRLLRTLVSFPDKEFTGRELAAQSGCAPPNTIHELNRLRRQGVVDRRTVGPAQIWRWRRRHILTRPLQALYEVETQAVEALKRTIVVGFSGLSGLDRLVLFGSVARGDMRPESDIDLLVIVTTTAAKERVGERVSTLRETVAETFGNELSALIYTDRELRAKRDEILVKNIERDGVLLWSTVP